MKNNSAGVFTVLLAMLSQRALVRVSERVTYNVAVGYGFVAVWLGVTPWWVLSIVHSRRPLRGGDFYLWDWIGALPVASVFAFFTSMLVTAGLTMLLQIAVGRPGDRRVIAGLLASWRWTVLTGIYLTCKVFGLIAELGERFWGRPAPAWIEPPIWSWATSGWLDIMVLVALGVITLWAATCTPAKFSREANICPACEYDLRATVAGGIGPCPECGAGIKPPQGQTVSPANE